MTLADIIAIAVIVLIVGGAVAYIIKAKKSGQKCIGCPDSKTCGQNHSQCSGSCGNCGNACHCNDE
ncbi:MAG: FeoB-associated Cys-rich membrane protein [Clostridia bacterium]|nr:FeoB-associated Cys-rich membrane protein [Clostridia bacterium]